MFSDRIEMTVTLETKTPTHVGSGEWGDMPLRAGANAPPPQYAKIVRDYGNEAYIPSTTLKGVFLRAAQQCLAEDDLKSLFGTTRANVAEGQPTGDAGLLLFRGAKLTSAPDAPEAPWWGKVGKGTFIAARTAIDGCTGVADDHLLFHQEMLPAGARFVLRLLLCTRRENIERRDEAALAALLEHISANGLRIGKSQADGQGELRFHGTPTLKKLVIGGDGELKQEQITTVAEIPAATKTQHAHPFRLICEAPFGVVDSSNDPAADREARHEEARKGDRPQIRAQRLDEKHPLLLGSSISGVLRARALWLARLDQMRTKATQNRDFATETKDGAQIIVERLFGALNWKALVEIRNLRVGEASEASITSLRVDRHSGAPIDNALFTTSAFRGIEISFDLALTKRPPPRHLDERELARRKSLDAAAGELFGVLVDDILRNGLTLGHGASKGFGWFKPPKTGD